MATVPAITSAFVRSDAVGSCGGAGLRRHDAVAVPITPIATRLNQPRDPRVGRAVPTADCTGGDELVIFNIEPPSNRQGWRL